MRAACRPVLAASLALSLLVSGCSPSPEPQNASTLASPTAVAGPQPRPEPTPVRTAHFGPYRPSEAARFVADRVVALDDAGGLPFLIVDKAAARVLAFDPSGRLVDEAPALLGLARGDESVPGIGERRIADIKPYERTTPAGRFVAEMGENKSGEDILWVDYDNAISMHRVRVVAAAQRRLQRLASATAEDNRISYGCINVPAAFFDNVVKPLLTPRNGVVYVLPETRPPTTLFESRPVAIAR